MYARIPSGGGTAVNHSSHRRPSAQRRPERLVVGFGQGLQAEAARFEDDGARVDHGGRLTRKSQETERQMATAGRLGGTARRDRS